MEKWVTIFNDYKVSSHGRVKGKRGILSPKTKKNGYKEVSLYPVPMKCKMFYVHRLVASAFIGVLNPGYEVNHKDGNKKNNKVSNLEIVTPSENRKHSYNVLNKKIAVYKGSNHGMSKLNEDDVLQIRDLYANGYMPTELSKRYKTPFSTICKIVYRQTWKHI